MTSPVELVLSRLKGVRPNGTGHMALCPAHDDRNPSLHVSSGDDGRALLVCFAGCPTESIVKQAGLQMADLFPRRETSHRAAPTFYPVTVAALARDKGLPEDFLRGIGLDNRSDFRGEGRPDLGGVLVPYRLLNGSLASRQRARTALSAKSGSVWLPGEGSPVPYGLDRQKDALERSSLVIVEGESDCWTLWHRGFPAIGIPGADMGGKIEAEHVVGLDRIFYWREPDRGGDTFAAKIPSRLREIGFIGDILEVAIDGVKDPADLFKRDPAAFDQVFEKALKEARKVEAATATAAKPAIDAGNQDLADVTAAAWDAVVKANKPERIFLFGDSPVRIETDDENLPALKPLTEDRTRGEVARSADWIRFVKTKDGMEKKAALPPSPVIRDMLALPKIPLPRLSAVIQAPAFGPGGTLHTRPGYDPAGRTYYAPAKGFLVPPVSPHPTAAERERARSFILDELLHDFPFTGDPERAHAVALLIQLFARNLIHGATPLYLAEKPTQGTGATLLVDVLMFPALGRSIAAMTEGRDEDEWRKRITAVLRGGASAVLIDNLRGRLDSAAVSSAITATLWEDRKLGTSDNVRLPVRCAWIATANNAALSGEISRRTVRIRLDAKVDRPWQRSGFRHPDLRAWVTEHRADLAWSAITIIQAWLATGRPIPSDLPTLGMFENWANVLGGVLHHAGIPGFLGNLSAFYDESDSEGAEMRAFLSSWWEKHQETPVGVAALWEIASSPESTLPLGEKGERSQRTRLGTLVRQLRDRRYQLGDGLTVCIKAAGKVSGAAQWRLTCGG